MYQNEAIKKVKVQEVKDNTKPFNGSHDFSHCNPEKQSTACPCCKRYIAHMALQALDKADFLVSYLSEPQATCIDRDLKLYLPY
jgi:hypothetical protein